MILIVLDKRSGLTPDIPDGVTVKLCTHPNQLIGKAKLEQFCATRATSFVAAMKLVTKATEMSHAMPQGSAYIYYVEIDVDGDRLRASISLVTDDGHIAPQLAEVRRGHFFAGNGNECTVEMTGARLSTNEHVEKYQEILEIARFIAHEIK